MKNLVLLLLLLSSLSIFAQNIDDCAQKSEKTQQNTSDVRYKASASEVNMGYSVTNADEVMVYDIVERMPTFPGGQAAMFKFIQHNMAYPSEAQNARIEGTVHLSFVVTKKGQITDVKIERGFGEGDLGCHEEAARIIKSMPKWHPGYKNGVPVNVRYSLPLKFKI